MPIDEIIGEVAGEVLEKSAGLIGDVAADAATQLVSGLIYSGRVARYFHGIGRQVIAIVSLRRIRIPSSLRRVPKGATPKPRRSDWLALWVGVGVWVTGMAALTWAILQ